MCKFLDFLKLFTEGSSPYKEGGLSGEIPSPRIAIDPTDLLFDPLHKSVTLRNVEAIEFTDVAGTNSMEPAIDKGHRVLISSHPKYAAKEVVKPGDVLLYKTQTGAWIIHSVIEVGEDIIGWYCKARGWNVNSPDPETIREEAITHIALGVIWCGKEEES